MDEKYELVERPPTLHEYQGLRKAVGWGDVDAEAIETGLKGALFSVCVVLGDRVIGCGRVIGDGGIYFYINDVIVLPEFQGKGLGRRIMDAIMGYLKSHARLGTNVGLMAAKDVSEFYVPYGFAKRTVDRPGMYRIWGR